MITAPTTDYQLAYRHNIRKAHVAARWGSGYLAYWYLAQAGQYAKVQRREYVRVKRELRQVFGQGQRSQAQAQAQGHGPQDRGHAGGPRGLH